MKMVLSLLILLIFLLLAGQTGASFWFQVTDVSPIRVEPNSDANFTVDVKGLGSEGAYVQVVFRNMSEGLSIASSDRLRYVFPTGTTRFNFTLRAGDIAPGNYSFEVGVVAKSSIPGWRMAYVDVVAAGVGETTEVAETANAEEIAEAEGTAEVEETNEVLPPGRETASQNVTAAPETEEAPAEAAQNRGMPGPGIALAIAALLLAGRRMRRLH
jgi:hypothetical protein